MEGTVLDHGSSVVAAPEGSILRGVIDDLEIPDRVDIEGIAFGTGVTRLAKLMAAGLDVRLGVRLAALRAARGGLELGDEQGNTHGVADRVVVAAPAPQAADLLERSPEGGARVEALRRLSYDPAVMVLLGLRLGNGVSWEVLRGTGEPIDEIRREAIKGRLPIDGVEPVVVRLAPDHSAGLIDASDDAVLAATLPALAAVIGEAGEKPHWQQVKRWRFAVPTGVADPDAVNPAGVRIVVAGDTLTGAGFGSSDHHRVYESGVIAARRVAQDIGEQ
jgi:predicted NAD/FAD-dependent oxidoreductase